MSSETLMLEGIRYTNDSRAADSREWVGGILFLLVCGMITFCCVLGLTQTHVISMKACSKVVEGLDDVRGMTITWIVFFNFFYFVVTVFGGMTGWIVSSSMLGTWWLILLIIGCVRRIKHRRDTKAALKKAAEEDDTMAKQIASGVFDPDLNDGSRSKISTGHLDDDAFGGMMEDSAADYGSSAFASKGQLKSGRKDPSMEVDENSGNLGEDGKDGNLTVNTGKKRKGGGVKFGDSVSNEGSPLGKRAQSNNFMGGSNSKSGIGGSFFGLDRKGSQVFDPQAFARRNALKKDEWTTSPEAMAPIQRTITLCMAALFIVILGIIWILLLSWKVSDYYYLGLSGGPKAEVVPIETAQALQCMYAFPGIATRFQLDLYVKLFTEYCHDRFTKTLSDSEKKEDIYDYWIYAYGVNMSEYVEPDYKQYNSVNDWLIRPIDLANRPAPVSPDAVTSPVDGRTLIYVIQEDLRIWLKGTKITYADLLGGLPLGGTAQYFNNGAAVISRLALQDYHRFHAPVAGTVLSITPISGTLWSVGPDASFSENDVLLNNRVVIIIDGGVRIGNVALIAVGATCVGSIQLQTSTGPLVEGSYVERGEQMGWIQFGGSTVVTLFSQGRILWDSSIIYRSRFPVETELLLNQQLGTLRP